MSWLVDCLQIWYDWMSNFYIFGHIDFISFVVLIFIVSLIVGVVLPQVEEEL